MPKKTEALKEKQRELKKPKQQEKMATTPAIQARTQSPITVHRGNSEVSQGSATDNPIDLDEEDEEDEEEEEEEDAEVEEKKKEKKEEKKEEKGKGKAKEKEKEEEKEKENEIEIEEEEEVLAALTSGQLTPGPSSQPLVPSQSLKDILRPDINVERQAQECVLSYNTISLSSFPAEPSFGTFNPRPLQNSAVNKLARAFVCDTFTPFAPQCMFPIIMYKQDLVEACINPTPSFDGSAPVLQVSDHVKRLLFCGGHHRVNAVIKAREDLTNTITECKRQITKYSNDQNKAAGTDSSDEDDDDEPLNPYVQLDLDLATERLSLIDTWGCIIYDKARIDKSPQIGIYLSQNKEEVKLRESPAERLHRELLLIVQGVAARDADPYIRQMGKRDAPSATVAAILREFEVRSVLVRMIKFNELLYRMSLPMSPEWMSTHLINIYGGMLVEVMQYGLDILEFCFSSHTPDELSSKKAELYYAHRQHKDASHSSKHAVFVTSMWTEVAEGGAEYHPDILDANFWKSTDVGNLERFGTIAKIMFHAEEKDYADAIRQYVKDTTKEHQTAVLKARPSDTAGRNVKEGLVEKLTWCLSDHGSYHYAPVMPLLTPSVIDCLGQLFATMPTALAEFYSWIYPLADTDVRRAKAAEESRDMSIIVMSAIKGNRGKVFMDHCIGDVLRTFALFPLKEVVAFHRLQLDMGPISSTTLMRLGKVDATAYRAVGMQSKDFIVKRDALKDWMKTNRQMVNQSWHDTVWPLNVEGKFVWRTEEVKGAKVKKAPKDLTDKKIKNVDRDFKVHAGFAFYEYLVAMKYRPQLLESSAAARWIRQRFTDAMGPFITSWKRKINGKLQNETVYIFPDMLECVKETEAPKVVVSDMNKTQAVAKIEKKALADFTKALERMQRHKFLFASPTGSVLDDKVRDALDTLAEAGRESISRHCKMHMDIEGGVPPETIIPDDPKYKVSKPSSVDLTFYKRIEGWSEHASSKASAPCNSDHVLTGTQQQASKTRSSKRIAAGTAKAKQGMSIHCMSVILTKQPRRSYSAKYVLIFAAVNPTDHRGILGKEMIVDSDEEAPPHVFVPQAGQPAQSAPPVPPKKLSAPKPVVSRPEDGMTIAAAAARLTLTSGVSAPGPSAPPQTPPPASMLVDAPSPPVSIADELMEPFNPAPPSNPDVNRVTDDHKMSASIPVPQRPPKRSSPQDSRSPGSSAPPPKRPQGGRKSKASVGFEV